MKKITLKSVRSILCVAACVFLINAVSNAQMLKVLIAASPSNTAWNSDVKAKLLAAGGFSQVDIFNIDSATPSLATLQQYQAVLLYTDASAANMVTLSNNMVAYVDSGGGVVTAVFANTQLNIGPPFSQNNAYDVLVPASQSGGSYLTLGTVYYPNSPLMWGVDSINGGSSSYLSPTVPVPGAYRIADWSSGDPLISVHDSVGPLMMTRVDLNFYPPSTTVRADFWNANTDGGIMMANALKYSAAPWAPTGDSAYVDSVCAGDADTLYVKGIKGNACWYTGAPQGTFVDSGSVIVVHPSVTTTYYVQNYFQKVFSMASDSITIVVRPASALTFTLAKDTVCSAISSVSLSASPGGGVFSGTGVSGNNFNPSVAGVGKFGITYTYTGGGDTCTTAVTDSIVVASCLGISPVNYLDSKVDVYPNPNDGSFSLSLGLNARRVKVDILDITGRNIYSNTVYNVKAGNTESYNLNLAPAMYIIKISVDGQNIVKKLSVK